MNKQKYVSSHRHISFSPTLLSVAVYCACAASAPAYAGSIVMTGPIDPVQPNVVPKYVIPLVIPPEMPRSGTTEPCPANAKCPRTDYNIALRQFQQQILPGGIWNTVNGRGDAFNPTTVWGYGAAGDPIPPTGVAPVPAVQSSFNYPSFTVENHADKTSTIRWINELVAINPATGFPYQLQNSQRTSLPHLFAVDRTLHWANPERLPCADHMTGAQMPGATNCRPFMDPNNSLLGQAYDGPVPMVVHVHGAAVNPYSDGFTESWWLAAGFDPKSPAPTPLSANYATRGGRYDQSLLFRNNSYPGSAAYSYENTQPATTLWYHDHTLGMTANNVYAGPAGFWLIRGDHTELNGIKVKEEPIVGKLPGSQTFQRPTNPKTRYDGRAGCDPNFDAACRANIREIPIAIQDRSFNADGSLFYPDSRSYFDGFAVPYLPLASSDVAPIHNPEFFGNMIVVNGAVWPTLDVVPQRYRFRLLAGADSRTFNLSMWAIPPGVALPDPYTKNYIADLKAITNVQEIPFYQIGAEQGFLPKVVKIKTGTAVQLPGDGSEPPASCTAENKALNILPSNPQDPGCHRALLMAPAERADVIVDFTGLPPGTKVRMINTGPDVPFNDLWFPPDVANPAGTGQIMEFNVVALSANTPKDKSSPPAKLVLNSELPNTAPVAATRRASLIENDSKKLCVTVDANGNLSVAVNDVPPCTSPGAIPFGPTETFVGTMADGANCKGCMPQQQAWADDITEAPTKGDSEIFEVYNYTVDAHPMHMHSARIQVVNREPLVIDPLTGLPFSPVQRSGLVQAPAPTEAGYKDIFIAEPGMVTRIKAKFETAGLYVWHCHIVEHEDNEMMVPFCIKNATSDTACNAAPGGTPWPIVNGGKGWFY